MLITITDPESGSMAQILASVGFNCFRWLPARRAGEPRNMLWSEANFASGEGRPSGSGIPLLFPFPGRIGGAAFEWEGRRYELEPADGRGNAIHGFVLNRPWRVIEQEEARVVGEFCASVEDPKILDQWPADFRIRVSYEVRGTELISDIRYTNMGDEPLPCGFGTHAYFRLPLSEESQVGETVVTVPAGHTWELDNMQPTGKQFPVAADQDLSNGRPLGELQFDTVFTGLTAEKDGLVRTRLMDPRSGQMVTQSFDKAFTQCVIYTPPHREAICLEPYTCIPGATDSRLAPMLRQGLQVLAPGETFQTTISIDAE